MTIITKKAFVEVVALLEKNKNRKVSTILGQIKEMTAQKANLKTFITDEAGKVVAIFCYYHKQWELVSKVEYGKKASSSTGFNTMCKIGVSKWTKQNNAVKAVSLTVLEMLEAEEITADEISATKERLVAEAKTIDKTDMPNGYLTAEDAVSA